MPPKDNYAHVATGTILHRPRCGHFSMLDDRGERLGICAGCLDRWRAETAYYGPIDALKSEAAR